MSYYTDVNTSYVQNEANRLQMINIINNKFYIHKSFDIQSDMEFLPHIPNNGNFMSPSPKPQYLVHSRNHPEYFNYEPKRTLQSGNMRSPGRVAPPGLDRGDENDWVVSQNNDKGW